MIVRVIVVLPTPPLSAPTRRTAGFMALAPVCALAGFLAMLTGLVLVRKRRSGGQRLRRNRARREWRTPGLVDGFFASRGGMSLPCRMFFASYTGQENGESGNNPAGFRDANRC